MCTCSEASSIYCNNIRKNSDIFLVLVPHCEARAEVQKHAGSLLKTGIKDVYPFPCVAPLAALDKLMDPDELKQYAHMLRKAADKNKFRVSEITASPLRVNNKNMELYGLKFDNFITAVIGLFLLPENKKQNITASKMNALPGLNLTFRAAAVANMFWKSFTEHEEIYFKWQIDKLFWLPKTNNKF